MHAKEHQMVDISGALYNGVPHNYIVVLGRKTPTINSRKAVVMAPVPVLVVLQSNPNITKRTIVRNMTVKLQSTDSAFACLRPTREREKGQLY